MALFSFTGFLGRRFYNGNENDDGCDGLGDGDNNYANDGEDAVIDNDDDDVRCP